MLGLQNEREWQAFCDQVLLQPALAADPRFDTNARRSAARQELRALIVEAFASMSAAQVALGLDRAGIANAQVNDMAQVWEHPQLKARDRWVTIDTPGGPVPAMLPPGAADAGAVRMDAVPAVGQHSDSILAGLGFSAQQIDELRRDGAL
jgi:itaconate CoA-transferase